MRKNILYVYTLFLSIGLNNTTYGESTPCNGCPTQGNYLQYCSDCQMSSENLTCECMDGMNAGGCSMLNLTKCPGYEQGNVSNVQVDATQAMILQCGTEIAKPVACDQINAKKLGSTKKKM